MDREARSGLRRILRLSAAVADEDPKDIMVWVEAPDEVAKGKTIEVEVRVKNARRKEAFAIWSVDFEDAYLDGFRFEGASPEPDDVDHSEGRLTLAHEIVLAPGDVQYFRVKLTAKKAGVFIGDVDVWEADGDDEPGDCVSRAAQTEIG